MLTAEAKYDKRTKINPFNSHSSGNNDCFIRYRNRLSYMAILFVVLSIEKAHPAAYWASEGIVLRRVGNVVRRRIDSAVDLRGKFKRARAVHASSSETLPSLSRTGSTKRPAEG